MIRVSALVTAVGTSAAALEAGVSVVDASTKQKREAKKSYQQALEALEGERLEEALGLLEASYASVASPNSHLLYARVLVKLERYAEAHEELALVIGSARELAKTDAKYEQTAQAAEKELGELTARLSTLTVLPSTRVRVDGEEVPAEKFGQPLLRAPGTVRVVLHHADGTRTETEIDLKPGQNAEVSTAPPAPKAEPPRAPPALAPPAPAPAPAPDAVSKKSLAFVAGGIGLAGIGAFTALKLMNSSGNERQGCDAQSCPNSTVRRAERSSALEAFGYVGLGIGVVGIASSTYLFLDTTPSNPEKPPGTTVSVGPGFVSLSGRF